MCREDIGAIQENWTTQLLKSTESIGRESVNATETLFLQLVSAFAVMSTLFMAVCILFYIVDIINLIKQDEKAKLCLMCVWLFTHAFYILMALVGLYSGTSICITDLGQIADLFASILNLVVTFLFLVRVMSYNRQLYVRQNTTTPKVPPAVIDISNKASPQPYSELYPPRTQEN
jgi:hypothetical protein